MEITARDSYRYAVVRTATPDTTALSCPTPVSIRSLSDSYSGKLQHLAPQGIPSKSSRPSSCCSTGVSPSVPVPSSSRSSSPPPKSTSKSAYTSWPSSSSSPSYRLSWAEVGKATSSSSRSSSTGRRSGERSGRRRGLGERRCGVDDGDLGLVAVVVCITWGGNPVTGACCPFPDLCMGTAPVFPPPFAPARPPRPAS